MKRFIIHYYPQLKERARQLRNESTQTEIMLWKYLKRKQRLGYDFHRQKPIDNYVVDFFCNQLQLAIEIDGLTHQVDEVYENDKRKEAKLNQLGIKVLRFQDDDVLNNIENVLLHIERYIQYSERQIHLP